MYYFKKENTFLHQFDKTTQRGYDNIGNKKSIFWLLNFLICIGIMFVPLLITMIGFGIILGVILALTNQLNDMNMFLSNVWMQWFSLFFQASIIILSFYIYIKFIEKRPFRSIGLTVNHKVKKYAIGSAVAIGMQLIYFSIILIFGWGEILSKPIYAINAYGPSAIGVVLLFLFAFLLQGASEEIVVRGWMLPVLSRHYKVSTAIILSSLFFGLLHMFNPNINVLSIVNLILYGIFAALYALYDDGLWGIFAQHSIWNWFMGNVLGLPVSGMIMGGASIIETNLTGPTWITGGGFGPEGGIIVSLILCFSSIILIRLLIKKGIIACSKY